MQKLITRKSDNLPLDWGNSVEYGAQGVRAVGRFDNPARLGPWTEGLTAKDVTITDVANDYGSAVNPPAPVYKQLSTGEFLDHCFRSLGAFVAPGGGAQAQFLAGMTRYGEIMTSIRASTEPLDVAANDRFNGAMSAGAWLRDVASQFFQIVSGFFKAGESDAILNGWPQE